MQILLWVLGVAAVLAAAAIIVGHMMPRRIKVSRSAVIDAPAERIFSLISDYKEFNRWSPWAEKDPNTVYDYDGEAGQIGHRMSWKSDHKHVGSGAQEIMLAEAPSRLRVKLDFGKQGTAEAQFDLKPAGAGGVEVTWTLDADMDASGKLLGVIPVGRFMGPMMDKWVGADYEAGLAKLKTVAESG
ncbi:MAG: K(+)-transporting ATPase subunit F [Parvularculaceae bacterium]